jgi:NAD(P)-dependent dehydrogenase (short-subunit alcohol dehydrogenase family)
MHRMKRLLISVISLIILSTSIQADEVQHTVLITGANRGIGFEFVRQFNDKGYRIIAACRNPAGAEALQALAADNENIFIERLDLVDLDGIDALAAKYTGQPIDILINNAALMRGPDKGQAFGSIDYEQFDTFFHTNVRGPLKVAEAFWPSVKISDERLVASLTTGQGSAGIPVPGFAYYKSSKAAIDNLHYDIGRKGRRDDIRVVTLMPGRVPTHGEKYRQGMVKVEDSVGSMIEIMEGFTIDQNGSTLRWNGEPSSP